MQSATHSATETLKLPAEEAIERDIPIIDAHHHLWHRPNYRYLLPEFFADISGRHNVQGSVYVEGSGALFRAARDSGVMYRDSGPLAFKSLGETEFANGMGAIAASGVYGHIAVAAGILGFVQLSDGSAVREPLEAHMQLSRFRGVRYHVAWHKDPAIKNPNLGTREGMLYDSKLRQGLKELERLGLTFDVTIIFTQLPDVLDLAKNHPNLTFILDHCGSPFVSGVYAGKHEDVYKQWNKSIREVAKLPNVIAKIGGLGKSKNGLQPPRLTSVDFAASWRPYVETTINLFGPSRCMFESNFPVDGIFVPYTMVWNAFKHITMRYTPEEKLSLYFGTANHVYRLGLVPRAAAAEAEKA